MSYITTEIKNYSYMFFPKQDSPAKISLYDAANIIFGTIYIRPDTEAISTAIIDASGKYRMYIHRKYLSDILDMLRNEKPVYFNYWEAGGDNTNINTRIEPVGENE